MVKVFTVTKKMKVKLAVVGGGAKECTYTVGHATSYTGTKLHWMEMMWCGIV